MSDVAIRSRSRTETVTQSGISHKRFRLGTGSDLNRTPPKTTHFLHDRELYGHIVQFISDPVPKLNPHLGRVLTGPELLPHALARGPALGESVAATASNLRARFDRTAPARARPTRVRSLSRDHR